MKKKYTHHTFAITTYALAAFLLYSTAGLANHACTDCHGSETPSSTDLLKPYSALCVDCHQDRITTGEHKIDIPATFTRGTELPLQKGKLSCITCHNPHQAGLALRLPVNELCKNCHEN